MLEIADYNFTVTGRVVIFWSKVSVYKSSKYILSYSVDNNKVHISYDSGNTFCTV
jgi:hypothetical protein